MTHSRIAAALLAFGAMAACSPPPASDAKAPEGPASAAAPASTGITITDAKARATPDGAAVAGGYLTITNGGQDADRLVSASSPRAPKMELHEMAMDGNMMTMRAVPGIDVPAGGTVELKPGGLHLMFMDIPAPFKAGETVPVTLNFEKAGAVETTLVVGDGGGMDGKAHGGQH